MTGIDNKVMFKIGYGLYVLTAREGDKDNGCIVNTVMQVTSSPLVLAVGVNKLNYTAGMIERTGQFNLSLLSKDTTFEQIKQFGFCSGKDTDKFKGETVTRADNGIAQVFKNVNGIISCKVAETLDFGTHWLFKAEVMAAESISELESLTYSYYQSNIKPKPAPAAAAAWRCSVCGYELKGELKDDFICPICNHGAKDFIKAL